MLKGLDVLYHQSDCPLRVGVERHDDAEECWWAVYPLQKLEESTMADKIKGLCKVHKRLTLFPTFFLEVFYREDHVYGGST